MNAEIRLPRRLHVRIIFHPQGSQRPELGVIFLAGSVQNVCDDPGPLPGCGDVALQLLAVEPVVRGDC